MMDVAARVGEGGGVARREAARGLGHRRLDLDRIHALQREVRSSVCVVRPVPMPMTAARFASGLERERQRARSASW